MLSAIICVFYFVVRDFSRIMCSYNYIIYIYIKQICKNYVKNYITTQKVAPAELASQKLNQFHHIQNQAVRNHFTPTKT